MSGSFVASSLGWVFCWGGSFLGAFCAVLGVVVYSVGDGEVGIYIFRGVADLINRSINQHSLS